MTHTQLQIFLNCIEFPDKATEDLTRDTLTKEGVTVSQLGICITHSDLDEIGIPEAARRTLLETEGRVGLSRSVYHMFYCYHL